MRCLMSCLLLLLATPAHAWYSAGHRLIALLAYEQLEPEVRGEYVTLLCAHPRFAEDFLEAMPAEVAASDDPDLRARWLFARAAVWPDLARAFEGAERDRFHRGTWHYTNGVLYLTELDAEAFAAGELALGPELPDPTTLNRALRAAPGSDPSRWNLMQALDHATHRLGDESEPAAERAVLLCWILHLVGDMHQPLHSTSLWSVSGFPGGDRGGNEVRLLGRRPNLHGFWDGALGSSETLCELDARVDRWRDTPELVELAERARREADWSVWLRESYTAAWQHAYTGEVLAELDRQRTGLALGEEFEGGSAPFALSLAYRVTAYDLARERAAAAGARLAALLGDASPTGPR